MSSTLQHFSHPKHPLVLKENAVLGVDAKCSVCDRTVIGSPTYTCSSDDIDCRSLYLHKTCAELPTKICYVHSKLDPMLLQPHRSTYTCYVCSQNIKFAYLSTFYDFVLCVNCAKLPEEINYNKHNQHPLTLLSVLDFLCNLCSSDVMFAYVCLQCEFGVCVNCVFEERVLHHEGHLHPLKLMHREALFDCDACFEKGKDSSYICTSTTCEFWIHKRCAFAPLIIPSPTYHHHPLYLKYSIPDMHRFFHRICALCKEVVQKNNWLYYCHKCTLFVHMQCAASSDLVSMVTDIEGEGQDSNDESDLVEFPLPSKESIFDFILTQAGKFTLDFQVEAENTIGIPTLPNDPEIIEEHWSHKNHPLERLQFSIGEKASSDNDDDKRVLICDGCIQPISVCHPSYYACIQCDFYLHSFCATKMPLKLPVGASSFHPQHSLLLQKTERFYDNVECGVCSYHTNGFYYHCETCNVKMDVRCAFFPARIKHKSHKNHSLVQRPISGSHHHCSLTNYGLVDGVEYACETCSSFQIHTLCLFNPHIVKHRYDLHPISLRYPPFYYEGVFYCEICEEQVNNQWWLYHCDKCNQSFHTECIIWYESVKLGGTIKLTISNQPHTFVFVLKGSIRKNSPMYICGNCGNSYKFTYGNCGNSYKFTYVFECDGCGLLVCRKCVRKLQ